MKGVLRYLGWRQPWLLLDGEVVTDFQDSFWDWVIRNGLEMRRDTERDSWSSGVPPVSVDQRGDTFRVYHEAGSSRYLSYGGRGHGVTHSKMEGFGFSNLTHYLESLLHKLNSRPVEVHCSSTEWQIKLAADAPEVHAVQYWQHGNSAHVMGPDIAAVCKAGTPDACCFFSLSSRGAECQKFNGSLTASILDRVALRTIRTQRIGDCRQSGREGWERGEDGRLRPIEGWEKHLENS